MPFAFTRPSTARSTNGFMRSAGYAVGRFMGSDSIFAHEWPSCARQKAWPFGMVHSLFLQVEATARRKPSDWVERTYRRSLATSWLKSWKPCSDSNSGTAFSIIRVLPLGTRRRARDHALARRARQPGADQLDHLRDREAVREHQRFRAAVATGGEQFQSASADRDWDTLTAALMARQCIGGRRCGSQYSMPDLARSAECLLAVPWPISKRHLTQEVPDFMALNPGARRDPI